VPVLEQPPIAAVELAGVLQALSDPVRLEIVRGLAADGERQCGTFELGVTKATRSHHFKVLREAGITHTRTEGTARFVTLRAAELDERFPGLLAAIVAG
jgi:DNA-binding transcriptional ArsR family regulator